MQYSCGSTAATYSIARKSAAPSGSLIITDFAPFPDAAAAPVAIRIGPNTARMYRRSAVPVAVIANASMKPNRLFKIPTICVFSPIY